MNLNKKIPKLHPILIFFQKYTLAAIEQAPGHTLQSGPLQQWSGSFCKKKNKQTSPALAARRGGGLAAMRDGGQYPRVISILGICPSP
jgi:hypothetical protein